MNENSSNVQTHHESIFVEKKTFSVTLCSAFRDSVPYLGRYLSQVTDLAARLSFERDIDLVCVWGEGDSVDDTLLELRDVAALYNATLVDCTHGGGDYGSVVKAERFRQLAHVGNTIWAAIPPETDIVVYVESDLIWQAGTILRLIDDLAEYPAVAPMVILDRPGWGKRDWYDTWATRKGNRHFRHHPPYHSCYDPDKPFRVDSTGSCMAIRGELARLLHFPEQDVFVGLSRLIYENGGSLWINPQVSVYHQ